MYNIVICDDEQEQIKKEYWEKIQENEEINKRIENIKSGEYKDLIKAMAISIVKSLISLFDKAFNFPTSVLITDISYLNEAIKYFNIFYSCC